jgi:phosphoserine aminotransferase
MVPINLLGARLHADYVLPGYWSLVASAEAHDLVQLKGHRSACGTRASLCNAMPQTGVQAMTSFMREFQRTYG